MDLSIEKREIPIPIPIPIPISNPIPITSKYAGEHGHGNMIHHNPTPKNHTIPSSATQHLNKKQQPYNNKVVIRYRECLKNHAAAMGGSVIDGCCEFMPGGEEGTLEALKCSACNCHRNFHRKEIEEGTESSHHPDHHLVNKIMGTKASILAQHQVLGRSEALGYPTPTIPTSSRETPPPKKIMMRSHSMGSSLPSESDEKEPHDVGKLGTRTLVPQLVKKRFRTKFTQDQKEKMLSFAEKVGWKIQKQEEALVQQICQEIGIKRRVLKVWMHNNKHNLLPINNSSFTT